MFAPIFPCHSESRECIEATGEGDGFEVEQTRKNPVEREHTGRERKRGWRRETRSGKMLSFHSRKDSQWGRKTEEKREEEEDQSRRSVK